MKQYLQILFIRLRCWLLKKVAGNTRVGINLTVEHEGLRRTSAGQFIFLDCEFLGPEKPEVARE